MRRLPNPWVLVPVILSAGAGAVVGGLVTEVSCRPGSCIPLAVIVAVIGAIATAAGTVTVVVLAMRSIAEWRVQGPPAEPDRSDPPGPPTC